MPRHLNMKTAIPCTLLAMLLGSLSAAAAAVEPGEVATRRVNFADLDLTRSAGVTVLYARIKSAAGEVCQPVNAREVESVMRSNRCTQQAIARAVADVNAPALTSYYLAKTGQAITLAQRR
jgi:UrcA family protein